MGENKADLLNEDIHRCANYPFLSSFEGKNILVIGATGMIGSYILKVLTKYFENRPNGGTLIAFCRNREKLHKKMGDDEKKVEVIVGDVCNQKLSFPQCDIVIFAAGATDYEVVNNSPDSIYSVNTTGLHNALLASLEAGAQRFVYFSSASVYGDVNARRLKEEIVGVCNFGNPKQVYSQSKRMGECICNCFSKQYGLDVRIVRPFHMYGPGMDLSNGNFINAIIKNAITGENIVLRSKGEARRNFTYLSDMICYILLIAASNQASITINLGSTINDMNVRECAEKIRRCSSVEVLYNYERSINPSNQFDMCPNLEKLRQVCFDMDFPIKELSFEEGIQRTLEYYKNVH